MNIPLTNICNNKRSIFLFTRKNGTLSIEEVKDFFPYFYELDPKGKFKAIDGNNLRKVYCSEPADVPKMRSLSSYSADILFTTNFMINKVDSILPTEIKYCLSPKTWVTTHNGIKQLKDVVVGDSLKSLDIRRNIFTNKVTAKINTYKKSFFVKTTNDSIISSENHKFYCLLKSKNKTSLQSLPNFYYQELKDFKIGDYFIILQNWLKLPEKIILNDWFWFLGYLFGDGSYQGSKNLNCDIVERDYKTIEKIKNVCDFYKFNYKITKKDKYHLIQISSVDFKDVLNEQLKNRDITPLFNLPIDYKLSFIAGFFDAEGSVSINKAKQITITNTNEAIIRWISTTLWSIGIYNSIIKTTKSNNFYLHILNDKKFKQYILFQSEDKRNKLEQINKKYYHSDRLPIIEYLKKLCCLSGEQCKTYNIKTWENTISRTEAKQVIDLLRDKSNRNSFRKLIKRLDFVINFCYFTKIKNIDCLGEKELIDITLDGKNGNFIANNIHTHNCFIDIEILATDLPETGSAKYPVSCISIYNSLSKDIQTWYIAEQEGTTLLEQEKSLLDKFIAYIKKEKPDIWFSWNVKFDYQYLYNRIKDFAKLISPIHLSRRGDEENIFFPCGISIVDYLSLFKKVYTREASYALDYITQKHLGAGKEFKNVDFSKLSDTIKKRNRGDVELLVKLEEKFKLVSYYDEIRRMTKCQWEDLYHNSRLVEHLLLEEAKNKQLVLPNKQNRDTLQDISDEPAFQGATRDVDAVGVFHNVGKLDLTSAYPSMIVNFCLDSQNILPEKEFCSCGLGGISSGLNCLKCGKMRCEDARAYVNGKYVGQTKINGLIFKQNSEALLPTIVTKILRLKDDLKKLKKTNPCQENNIKYDAIKAIVNSTFGVMGSPYFRLFNIDVASTITFLVRDLLMYVKSKVEAEGIKVLYWDTDSTFLSVKDDVSAKLNQYIKDWAKEKYNKDNIDLKFEYEGYFTSIIMLGKCHYYGYINGKKDPEIKGIEAKRSSSSKFEAQFQEALLNHIINGETREDIIEWIGEQKEVIKERSIEDIAFPCKLTSKEYKNYPIHKRAHNNTKNIKKSFKIKVGELFYYIFTKDSNNVLAFSADDNDFIKQDNIDWVRIIERNIDSKAEKIFSALKWHLPENTNQLQLF